MKLSRTLPRCSPALALALAASLVLSGCATSAPPPRAHLRHVADRFPEPVRPVIVIPGFGNSRLVDPVEEKVVWGLVRNLFFTSYSVDLDLPVDPAAHRFRADRLVPDGSFGGSRASFNIAFSLSRALRNHGGYVDARIDPDSRSAMHAFAYDWRLSATTNARRLGELVDSIRSRHPAPAPKIDLVAHSAGGLIALAYLKMGGLDPAAPEEELDHAAREAAAKIASVTLIGVPQRGTNEAVRVLARGEKIIRRDLTPAMMATFPSLPELLPADGRVFIDEQGRSLDLDVWDPAAWETLGFAIWSGDPTSEMRAAFARSLERARRLRSRLERPIPGGVRQTVIAADCVPTAARILRRSDRTLALYQAELRDDERWLEATMFVPGDGSIEARSALLEPGAGEVFCAGHHGLARDAGVRQAMLRGLLDRAGRASEPVHAGVPRAPVGSVESPNTR